MIKSKASLFFMTDEEIESRALSFHVKYSDILFDEHKVRVELIIEKELAQRKWSLEEVFNKPISETLDSKTPGLTDFRKKKVLIDGRDCKDHKDAPHSFTRRQTYGHELFHVFNHSIYVYCNGMEGWPAKFEYDANNFGRKLLLPSEKFKDLFRSQCVYYQLYNHNSNLIENLKSKEILVEKVIPKIAIMTEAPTLSVAIRIKDLLLCSSVFAESLIKKAKGKKYKLDILSKELF